MATPSAPTQDLAQRESQLFQEQQQANYARTDRVFAYLMMVQWLAGVVVAAVFSPYSWEGKAHNIHLHVYVALFLGGAISSLPIILAYAQPGRPSTRYVIAVAQMLWSALLIHLTGGRIETHFHVFGSLAFLAFYRDWRVLVPATIVVAADHFLRGMYWPESVYGMFFPQWWRFIEHAFWVVFEDVVLIMSCIVGVQDMHVVALRRAEAEALTESETTKSRALDRALHDLQGSHETLMRTEKLAAVGQLAASVGHELRNPLTAVRNANTYIAKKLAGVDNTDARVTQFLGVIDRELAVCNKIIADLLDFARERPAAPAPCPLHPLVAEAISVLTIPAHVTLKNQIPEDLPIPDLDRDQFRQIIGNLVQNAVEAVPADQRGTVTVRAEGGGGVAWRVVVEDDGPGIPADKLARIFEPLFTTKTKGTGLGLAIVSNAVKRHSGTIQVASEPGRTRFTIELPAVAVTAA